MNNNKNNDKKNNHSAGFDGAFSADIFELDANCLRLVGGGVGGDAAGPIDIG